MTPEPLADQPATDLHVAETTLLMAGKIWDVRRDRFELNGKNLVRDYVDHPGAVAVLALNDDGRVLLIRQYRHAIAYRDWEIPAGLMDVAGEPALAAAQRELAEEVDLQAARWDLLIDTYTSPGGLSETMRIFLARDLSPVAHNFVREGEEAEMLTKWVPLDEAVSAALSGDVQNGVTTNAVLAAFVSRQSDWSTLRSPTSAWPRREAARGERSAATEPAGASASTPPVVITP